VGTSLRKSGSPFDPPFSFVNSVMLITAAAVLGVLTREAAKEPETELPFGASQSR